MPGRAEGLWQSQDRGRASRTPEPPARQQGPLSSGAEAPSPSTAACQVSQVKHNASCFLLLLLPPVLLLFLPTRKPRWEVGGTAASAKQGHPQGPRCPTQEGPGSEAVGPQGPPAESGSPRWRAVKGGDQELPHPSPALGRAAGPAPSSRTCCDDGDILQHPVQLSGATFCY